jgi:endonuclease-8
MPEGHTIHRLARDHRASLAGQRLTVSSPQGRFAEGATKLNGRKLDRIEAAGKHLFYHFAKAPILHVHLGLFGKYRMHDNPPPPPRGAVRVRFEGKRKTVDLNGPNTCELLEPVEYRAILARLGPDPLRDDADVERAWARIHRSTAPIGLLLMDQSVIAGIGNIYRSELLHLIGVHPRTPGKAITKRQFTKLWKLAVELLRLGVEHNRIITIDPKTLPKDMSRVPRRKLFRIFKKAACPSCDGEIERFTLANRKVFACPACQSDGAAETTPNVRRQPKPRRRPAKPSRIA